MRKISLIISVVFLVILSSCTKQPTASFSVSSSTVTVDENVSFNNSSTDAKSYEWSFGDGNTSYSSNPTHSYSSTGSYTVRLTAINKSKEDTYSRTVTVEETKGEVIFSSDFSGPPINVYFSGSYAGQITAIETSYPDCGESGSVTKSNLNPETYSFTADETDSPYRHWSGSVQIEANTCFKMNLTSSKSGEAFAKEIIYGEDGKFESLITGKKTK